MLGIGLTILPARAQTVGKVEEATEIPTVLDEQKLSFHESVVPDDFIDEAFSLNQSVELESAQVEESISLDESVEWVAIASPQLSLEESLAGNQEPSFSPTLLSQNAPVRPQNLPPDKPLPDTLIVPQPDLDLPDAVNPTEPQTPPKIESDTDTLTVNKFKVVGSTVFTDKAFDEALKPYTRRPITLVELFEARSVVNQMYETEGYITTGAYIPEQTLRGENLVVTIGVVEGQVEEIRVQGTERLSRGYVRSRLRPGTATPLNRGRLLGALRLLQLNPLIDRVNAELATSPKPGTNILEVEVIEAKRTFTAQARLNNHRIPSVGSLRRGLELREANFLGLGDGISVGYDNTDGSDSFNLSYSIPFNGLDGSFNFRYGTGSSRIIEPPFDQLEIESDSRYYEFGIRQPILRRSPQDSLTEEVALGLTFFHIRSETTLLGIPFPLSAGADVEGRTRLSVLRFSQEWTRQSRTQVLAARSQFSFGLGSALDSSLNDDAPDSRFFAWRGQFQWLELLGQPRGNPPAAPLFLFQADVQVADRPLLSLEQFAIGGAGSVRGYRQDALLTDNGAFLSAEVRLPIFSIPALKTSVQLVPFVDLGTGWNSGRSADPDPSTLASVGLGLQLTNPDGFNARLDWGIPLVNLPSSERTWQENGIHFSLAFNLSL